MDKVNSRREKRASPGGHGGLLLLVLLGVAGTLLLYAYYMGALSRCLRFTRPKTKVTRYSDPNAYPWEESDLFISELLDGYDMGGRRPPFRSQPKLTHMLRYRAAVYDGDKPRGEIMLKVRKNGNAEGIWEADFWLGRRHYQTPERREDDLRNRKLNLFEGNTAPLKIYEDENGKDNSKLYVITKGVFHLDELRKGGKALGPAYLTAWLDRDYYAQGTLAIPSFADEGKAIFEWGPVEPLEE